MKRCFLWSLTSLTLLAGAIHADEAPALPKTTLSSEWTYAKVAEDADGKPVVIKYRPESRTITEMRTVTKFVKQTRIVDGEKVTLEVPQVETAPVQVRIWVWKAAVAALEDPRVKFFNVAGKQLNPEDVDSRLAKPLPVQYAEGQPEAFYLQTAKPDTIVLVAPAKAFAELPGISKEPLPTKGGNAFPAYARCTVTAGKRTLELLQLNYKRSKSVEFRIDPYWMAMDVPLEHGELKVQTLQGKRLTDAETIASFKQWTQVVMGDADPNPLMVNGVKPDTLLVAIPQNVLNQTQREYGQPVPEQNSNDTKSAIPAPQPKIERLPLPPLPPAATPNLPPPNPPVVQPEPKGDTVPADGPPLAVVKKMLEVQWGPLGRFTKHEYDFKSIRFAVPLKEVVTVNGQGNFTGKLRYPVRVQCDITVIFNDGTSRMETKHQTFHFYRDSFGEWSFRFIENN
jgi:hypothetical protein